jgi:hypothetical protein
LGRGYCHHPAREGGEKAVSFPDMPAGGAAERNPWDLFLNNMDPAVKGGEELQDGVVSGGMQYCLHIDNSQVKVFRFLVNNSPDPMLRI